MKFLPVVAAGAVGSIITAVSIHSANANNSELAMYVRHATESARASDGETNGPDETETATVETDPPAEDLESVDEAEPGSEPPAPDEKVEAPTPTTSEPQAEPETEAPDDRATQVEEAPLQGSVELFSVVPIEVSPVEGTTLPAEVSVLEAVLPPSLNSPADVVHPQR